METLNHGPPFLKNIILGCVSIGELKKHAYLIIAHNEYWLLNRLISLVDDERNDIYVHINRNSDFDVNRDILLPTKSSICFIDRSSVGWGSDKYIQIVIELLKNAKKRTRYSYYHVLSGVDLPIKNQDCIHDFFDKNEDKIFIRCSSIEDEKTYDRFRYYYPFQEEIGRDKYSSPYSNIQNSLVKTQSNMGINRVNPNIKYYKSNISYSFNDDFVEYILSNVVFIKANFGLTFGSDEHAFITLAMNSKFKNSVYGIDLHHVRWVSSLPFGTPYYWRSIDYNELIESSDLFARKFSESVDYNIIEMITSYVKTGKKTEIDGKKLSLYATDYLEEYLIAAKDTKNIMVFIANGDISDVFVELKNLFNFNIEYAPWQSAIMVYDCNENKIKYEGCSNERIDAHIEEYNIEMRSSGYVNECNIGFAYLRSKNKFYKMVSGSGLNIYLLDPDHFDIFDSICAGGMFGFKKAIRRPRIIIRDDFEFENDVDFEIKRLRNAYIYDFDKKIKLIEILRNRPDTSVEIDNIIDELVELGSSDGEYYKSLQYLEAGNIESAYRLLIDASEKGNSKAAFKLCTLVWDEKSVLSIEDKTRLMNPVMKYLYYDFPVIYYYIGLSYRDGIGVQCNIEDAILWLNKALNCGVDMVKTELYSLLWSTNEIEHIAELKRLAEADAKQGLYGSMEWLGKIYWKGKFVPVDLEKAAYWMNKAINKKQPWIVSELCEILWNSTNVEDKLFEVAYAHSINGNKYAMEWLGKIYWKGKGVPINLEKAAYWMKKSADLELSWAKIELENICNELNKKS